MAPDILLLNPNTSLEITALVARAARAAAAPGTRFTEVTAAFGPRYIGSRAQVAIAGHAALDAYAGAMAAPGAHFDAVILACFGDPGLAALREVSPVPVVGMADASFRVAASEPGRFAVLTGGPRWVPMLEELIQLLGFADRCAAVRAVPQTGAEIAANPDGAVDALAAQAQACADKDGATSVILGGAGLAGLTARIQAKVRVRLIDSVAASVAMAEAPTGTGPQRCRPIPGVESVGLSPALAALMSRGIGT